MKNKKRDGRGRDVPTHQKPKTKPKKLKEPEEILLMLIDNAFSQAVATFKKQLSN